MEELDISASLLQNDLFDLFKKQLRKDFEGSGLEGQFAEVLPPVFDLLKASLMQELHPLVRNNSSLLASLLYRVDISERQLKSYREASTGMDMEELLSELIIKRILQKIILKKKFSE